MQFSLQLVLQRKKSIASFNMLHFAVSSFGKKFLFQAAICNGLTLSGPAFSVVRQPGGEGSETRMPKIKVNINWLKLNSSWVIISIKAFLMQNLRLIALLVLEIWRNKIFLRRREQVIRFDYLPPENWFNFNEFLCPESFF